MEVHRLLFQNLEKKNKIYAHFKSLTTENRRKFENEVADKIIKKSLPLFTCQSKKWDRCWGLFLVIPIRFLVEGIYMTLTYQLTTSL